jgi:hypothetical protein
VPGPVVADKIEWSKAGTKFLRYPILSRSTCSIVNGTRSTDGMIDNLGLEVTCGCSTWLLINVRKLIFCSNCRSTILQHILPLEPESTTVSPAIPKVSSRISFLQAKLVNEENKIRTRDQFHCKIIMTSTLTIHAVLRLAISFTTGNVLLNDCKG